MTGRSKDEWLGATPDSKVPDRVRLRVFEKYGGVCQLTGVKIMPGDAWDLDHRQPLEDQGEHRESNLWPVLHKAHLIKTAAENRQRAKDRRVRKKHLGIGGPKAKLPGSKGSKWKRTIGGKTVLREED